MAACMMPRKNKLVRRPPEPVADKYLPASDPFRDMVRCEIRQALEHYTTKGLLYMTALGSVSAVGVIVGVGIAFLKLTE